MSPTRSAASKAAGFISSSVNHMSANEIEVAGLSGHELGVSLDRLVNRAKARYPNIFSDILTHRPYAL